MFHMLHADEETEKRGLIVIFIASTDTPKRDMTEFNRIGFRMIKSCPVRWVTVHHCFLGEVSVFSQSLKILTPLMPKHFRNAIELHIGT